MGIENLKPLNHHYSFCDVPSVYDEESLTALELCSRTAAKMNETIRLLQGECKEQNITIDDAVKFMKDNLDESLHELAYQLAESGELEILSEVNYNNMKKHLTTVINVKECGAVGDGVTDDTQAFIDAMALGKNIYVPAGNYLISSTLNLDTFYRFYGEGAKNSVITYAGLPPANGTNYLFNVTTLYNNKPIIENLGFQGAYNGFLLCGRDSWGASVTLRNCNVSGFNDGALYFKSSFLPIIENCVFECVAPIHFTTCDGTFTENNFSNCVYFKNCLFVGREDKTFTAFFIQNVRLMVFDGCTFEKFSQLFSATNNARHISLIECWFEDIGSLYYIDASSNVPVLIRPNLVRVTKFNRDATAIDRIEGAPYISIVSGATNTMEELFKSTNADNMIVNYNVYNPTDNYAEYFSPYTLTENRATYRVPLNIAYEELTFSDNTAMSTQNFAPILKIFGRVPPCGVYVKTKIIFNYADGDYIVREVDVFKDKSGYSKIIFEAETYRSTWSGSAGHNDTTNLLLTQSADGVAGNFKLLYSTSGNRCIKVEIFAEANICGY